MKSLRSIFIFAFLGFAILEGLFANQQQIFAIQYSKLIENRNNNFHAEIEAIKEGDLIFQTSRSAQSKAVQLATKSPYSHCGIIFRDSHELYVFEAVQPVKRTPLKEWIARGKDGKFVIKRLINAEKQLTSNVIAKMKEIAQSFQGKNYDLTFEWSDEKMYCSELIWKIYQRSTGLEIGKLEKLKNFDLSNQTVKNIMKERYAKSIPYNETVISPVSIFKSELLVTVK